MVWRWSAVAAMAWTRGASRAQAKKHVDGNNIGPSHIISLGDHAGDGSGRGHVRRKENDKGEKVLRGGGGEERHQLCGNQPLRRVHAGVASIAWRMTRRFRNAVI